MSKKEYEIALGAAFVLHINETIMSVASGSNRSQKASINKNVSVRTRGFQLGPDDLRKMNTAAQITLAEALDTVSGNNAIKKNQIVSELWPTTEEIAISLSLTPDKKFVWSLDLD